MRHQSLLLSRLALRRRPLAYWCTTVVVAAAAALLVGALTARAEAAAARYGGLRPVAVITAPVDAGDEVDAGDVRIERLPRAFVPEGALSAVPDGRTALGPLYPGEVVLAERLAPDGTSEVVADAATVVDAGDATTTVAVRVSDAPSVATALTQATVTLALAAPG